jgi:COMPASS component SDC1
MADANPNSNPAPLAIDPELAAPAPLQNGTMFTPTSADVDMHDIQPVSIPASTESAQSLLQNPYVAPPTAAATPVAAPTPTTTRNSPHPSAPSQAPTQPWPHGSPTRVYLNQHVTPHLLEAMKHLATNE